MIENGSKNAHDRVHCAFLCYGNGSARLIEGTFAKKEQGIWMTGKSLEVLRLRGIFVWI